MIEQNALTALIPILPARLEALEAYLGKIGPHVEKNPDLRFRESQSTHFARFVLLRLPERPPRLYFSACYDGPLQAYLDELAQKLSRGLEPIWACCACYSPGAGATGAGLASFLKPHSLAPDIFLIAFPGLSARRILENAELRERADECLDLLSGRPLVNTTSDRHPLTQVKERPSTESGFLTKLVNWLVGVRPGAKAPNTNLETKPQLSTMEDLVIQNQMTIVSAIKKGFWSRQILRFFLWYGRRTNKATPEGRLSGLSTIHFARWVLLDGGDNLLFESNYDGSWESYIDDFGDHAATGMNAVWGNSVGFPKGGSLDIEAFKQGIRHNQHPAQVWYSAYPNLTVSNIATDRDLRATLSPAGLFASGSYS